MGVSGSGGLSRVAAILGKEFATEMRARYGIGATVMFVVVVSVVIAFALGLERPTPQVTAALLWIAFFFTSVAGLARSFAVEQERGTMLLLRLHVSSTPVYFGKLLYNIAIAVLSNVLVATLLNLFLPHAWNGSIGDLLGATLLLSLGFAAAMTIVSAILAHASAQGALGAVLALPLLLPLVYLGVDMLATGAAGGASAVASTTGLLAAAYSIVVILLSYVLLDFVWEE